MARLLGWGQGLGLETHLMQVKRKRSPKMWATTFFKPSKIISQFTRQMFCLNYHELSFCYNSLNEDISLLKRKADSLQLSLFVGKPVFCSRTMLSEKCCHRSPYPSAPYEPHREKTSFLLMRKQRRRSASQ